MSLQSWSVAWPLELVGSIEPDVTKNDTWLKPQKFFCGRRRLIAAVALRCASSYKMNGFLRWRNVWSSDRLTWTM